MKTGPSQDNFRTYLWERRWSLLAEMSLTALKPFAYAFIGIPGLALEPALFQSSKLAGSFDLNYLVIDATGARACLLERKLFSTARSDGWGVLLLPTLYTAPVALEPTSTSAPTFKRNKRASCR